jgi:hypothetical protein
MKRRYPGEHTSYILMPDPSRLNSIDGAAFDAWTSTGNHGPAAQPVVVRMSGDLPVLSQWVGRAGVPGGAASADTLTNYYLGRYDSSAPHPSVHTYRGLEAYRAALASLPQSPDLASVYGSALRVAGPIASHCSTNAPTTNPTTAPDTTLQSLNMAAWLIQNKGTRYVGMIDAGIGRDTDTAYDGHNQSAGVTYGNLERLLKHLCDFIAPPGTTPSPTQVSLDDVLIVLNTEFGRTPTVGMLPPNGRDHYGAGYVTVLIGGPIQPTMGGSPRFLGTLDSVAGASVIGTFTPANLAWLCLEAAGIWQENADNFALNDRPFVPGSSDANPANAVFNA